MNKSRVSPGSPKQQIVPSSSQRPKAPRPTGCHSPIVPPGLQMPPGTRGPPGLQMHPGPAGPQVSTELLRQQDPSKATVSPGPSAFPRLPIPFIFPRRARKERTVYTTQQQRVLEEAFHRNKYPSYEERLVLAEKLQLPEPQIQIWFKNYRAKISRLYFKNYLQEPPWMYTKGDGADLSSCGAGAGPSCSGSHKASADTDEVCLSPSRDMPQQSPSGVFHIRDQDWNGRSCRREHTPGVIEDAPLPPSTTAAGRALTPAPEAARHDAAAPGTCQSPAAGARAPEAARQAVEEPALGTSPTPVQTQPQTQP